MLRWTPSRADGSLAAHVTGTAPRVATGDDEARSFVIGDFRLVPAQLFAAP